MLLWSGRPELTSTTPERWRRLEDICIKWSHSSSVSNLCTTHARGCQERSSTCSQHQSTIAVRKLGLRLRSVDCGYQFVPSWKPHNTFLHNMKFWTHEFWQHEILNTQLRTYTDHANDCYRRTLSPPHHVKWSGNIILHSYGQSPNFFWDLTLCSTICSIDASWSH